MLLRFLPAFVVLLGPAVAVAAPAMLDTAHPLSGTLWDTRSGRQVGERQMLAEAAAARWVLLGEKHDNAVHHALQARVVDALGRSGRSYAVVWEMAEPAHSEALTQAELGTVAALGAALDWEARGWPAWADYRPIAEAALRHDLPMRPGKPPGELARRLSRGEPLAAELAGRLVWRQPYPPALEADLLAELHVSHCGQLPGAALTAMLKVQRLWDAWMADSMLAAGAAGAVLIAGAGHVREDRAVPWQLRLREAGEAFTLALVEVAPGREAARDYLSFDPRRFDFVWFTPRVDDGDPCEDLRSRKPEAR